MISRIITAIEQRAALLRRLLLTLQGSDGGFKGYHVYDQESGIGNTAEVFHVLAKSHHPGMESCLLNASVYLRANQNPDGGWPFRPGGKSITDITAWACLALSYSGQQTVIQKGIEFLLRARINEGLQNEAGWGLTTFETDRVYSTYIASYCLTRILQSPLGSSEELIVNEMKAALAEAKSWLLGTRHADGGWGATQAAPSNYSSTALALLALFMQGEDPKAYVDSFRYLRGGLRSNLWDREMEVVITREGYELAQEWFTSAYCFRALIYFAEMEIATLEEVDDIFNAMLGLIEPDGRVRPGQGSSADLAWTISHMLDVLEKYRHFITLHKQEYNTFQQRKYQALVQQKKDAVAEHLHRSFPYPISHVFVQYEHELDYHRRFQLLLQFYEVMVKYAAIVSLSGHLAGRERNPVISSALQKRLERPSLGDWAALLTLLLGECRESQTILYPKKGPDILAKRTNYLVDTEPERNLDQELSKIVSARNRHAGHGALQSLYEYKQIIEGEQNHLYSFIDRMSYLAEYNSFLVLSTEYDEFGEGDRYLIRSFNGLKIQDSELQTSRRLSEGRKDQMIRYIYFQNTHNNTIVNLYPFLSFMICPDCKREHFFFFNGKKDADTMAYLSYECGHVAESQNREHFAKRLSGCDIQW